jgi:hypothetical protein
MYDEDFTMEKPIVLPDVSIVRGYKVICSEEKCNGRISFEPTMEQAEEKRVIHIEAHRKHEEAMREKLADLLGDSEGAEGSLPGLHCPSSLCHTAVGFPHTAQCDIAVCLSTGMQRLIRDHVPVNDPSHECGNDVWTGYYPGEREALAYGVPMKVLKTFGQWNEAALQWELKSGWEEAMHARGMGPKISGV